MQLLVDREFVAREIYQGQALPMFTHLTPNAFDLPHRLRYCPGSGPALRPRICAPNDCRRHDWGGAELVDDVWHYESNPVRIKFIVRVEDERRELGNLVRVALEEAGFQVQQNLQPFAPAIQSVICHRPQASRLAHLYRRLGPWRAQSLRPRQRELLQCAVAGQHAGLA